MASLDRAIKGIMRDWGHNILLQRKNPNGKGFQQKLERHTVRHMHPSSAGLARLQHEQPEGVTHSVDMIYYFLPDARPREGDRIYERDDRMDGLDSNNDSYAQTTWLIDYASPMRGKGGRIVYFVVGVTREEPN